MGTVFLELNQQPRPKGTGYVGSDKNGFYAGLIPSQTIHSEVTSNTLKLPRASGFLGIKPACE